VKSSVAAVVLFLSVSARADVWDPPIAAELAMKTPEIEPQADAEALLWDVRVSHELNEGLGRTEEWHYLRIKIFSEAGRDRLGTVDIPYATNQSVSHIAGRTIRPDGSVAELRKESVYERTLAKAGAVKVNVKSFALPGVEVGSIIEYRWKQTTEYGVHMELKLDFQRDIPVHLVRYHIRPITDPEFPLGMGSLGMNVSMSPIVKEKDGYYVTSASRIPAFKEERDMPPEAMVRPWMLVYYSLSQGETPQRYWETLGKRLYQGYSGAIKVNSEIRAAAAAAVKDVPPDDEARLRKLFDFLAVEVANTSYALDEGAAASRPRTEENQNTADTWKQKAGTSYDVTLLYIAFAEALGYEARLARVSRRDFGGFVPRLTHTYFLRDSVVAVKVAGAWKFCDPGYPFLPFGLLYASEQGQAAIVTDPKRPELVSLPIAPPEASETRREGTLKLAADGTLEGDVRVSYSGYFASWRKAQYQRQAVAQSDEAARDTLKRWFGASEVSDVKLAGLTPSDPLTIACRVKISGYAQRAGQRLLLQSAFFNRGDEPRYTASERRHPVEFDNAWLEHDTLTFELPEGFSLESPEAPGGMSISGVGEYSTRMGTSADGRTLHYERRFDFGRGGRLSFSAAAYAKIRAAFDNVRELDSHMLALKQESR